jgi:hypothetical protein
LRLQYRGARPSFTLGFRKLRARLKKRLSVGLLKQFKFLKTDSDLRDILIVWALAIGSGLSAALTSDLAKVGGQFKSRFAERSNPLGVPAFAFRGGFYHLGRWKPCESHFSQRSSC